MSESIIPRSSSSLDRPATRGRARNSWNRFFYRLDFNAPWRKRPTLFSFFLFFFAAPTAQPNKKINNTRQCCCTIFSGCWVLEAERLLFYRWLVKCGETADNERALRRFSARLLCASFKHQFLYFPRRCSMTTWALLFLRLSVLGRKETTSLCLLPLLAKRKKYKNNTTTEEQEQSSYDCVRAAGWKPGNEWDNGRWKAGGPDVNNTRTQPARGNQVGPKLPPVQRTLYPHKAQSRSW